VSGRRVEQLAAVRKERLKRLDDVMEKIGKENRTQLSADLCREHEKAVRGWTAARAAGGRGRRGVRRKGGLPRRLNAAKEESYLERVLALPAEAKAAGTAWLQKIVDGAGAPA
jgi:hypothetical protein